MQHLSGTEGGGSGTGIGEYTETIKEGFRIATGESVFWRSKNISIATPALKYANALSLPDYLPIDNKKGEANPFRVRSAKLGETKGCRASTDGSHCVRVPDSDSVNMGNACTF